MINFLNADYNFCFFIFYYRKTVKIVPLLSLTFCPILLTTIEKKK